MTEVVAGLIVDADGRLLACLRPADKHLGGKWEFPGGKVEASEDHAAALVRELEEELGIQVVVGYPLTPVPWDYGTLRIRLHPFLCRIASGIPQPREHAEIRWVARHELEQLDWAAADLPILAEWLAATGTRR
jgi:8-oxo-dGTP diphosphatase